MVVAVVQQLSSDLINALAVKINNLNYQALI